ncbi:hypothetical protein HZU77_013355 [Neisseriaceae bacterium TC5R-5]|nr:hypothetical protein [Neisseriaceae bacterium TC5R-5]
MSRYRYSGPTSGVTLQQGDTAREIMLHAGAEVDLPEQHEYTQTLLALGHLTLLPGQNKPAKASTRASDSDVSTISKGV